MFYKKEKFLLALILSINAIVILVFADDATTNDEVNLSSYDIARLRKFKAENHYVITKDNYRINVVRIPPVFKGRGSMNRRPVIFNHGSTQSSTYFMTNSVGARPIDYSNYNAANMSLDSLEQLLAKNKSITTSMPLLMSCFGYDVWLINRRGTEYSLGFAKKSNNSRGSGNSRKTARSGNDDDDDDDITTPQSKASSSPTTSISGLFQTIISGLKSYFDLLSKPQLNLGSISNTFDTKYWNFSLDEQCKYDLPAIIDYVLAETKQEKVAYIGHSIGNVLMFMLQSQQPEWADKVEPFLAWSPDMYLAHTTSILKPLLVSLQPILSLVSVPFPPTPIDPLTRTLLASLCQTKLEQDTLCRLLDDSMFGYSGNQQLTKPAFVASQFYSISSHEAVQLAQTTEKGKLHYYDYGLIGNSIAYGEDEPPIYDVSNIRSDSISMWHGGKDILASPADVKTLISDFNVTIDDRFITSVPFGHYDLLFGRDAPRLVNLPSLQLIESYAN